MTSQHENPSDNAVPFRRGVQRRDWAVVSVVAVIAIGLGIYLLARPTTSGNNTAADNPVVAAPGAAAAATASSAAAATKGRATGPRPPGSGRSAIWRTGSPVTLARGSVNAPVVMVMFCDVRCPFCAEFSRTTEPVLVKKYVDTGILRIEWRDFPIFRAQSTAAAIAGRAAAAQGRFFPGGKEMMELANPERWQALLCADRDGRNVKQQWTRAGARWTIGGAAKLTCFNGVNTGGDRMSWA